MRVLLGDVLTVLWLVIAGLGVLLLTIRSVQWAVNRRRRPAKVVPLPVPPEQPRRAA